MSIKEVSEYSLQTTYACGHVWKSNLVPLDHTQEERERMIRAIERWSESDCWSCQQCRGNAFREPHNRREIALADLNG